LVNKARRKGRGCYDPALKTERMPDDEEVRIISSLG
jgi:hypothetical protein